MAGLELVIADRSSEARIFRWPINFSLALTGLLLSRPVVIFFYGLWKFSGEGLLSLFNGSTEAFPGRFILVLLCFDLLIYWQHRLFHHFSWAWRFHRIHHLDEFIDISSALRFHPVEIFFSVLIKISFAALLGASAEEYAIFEIVLSSLAIFNHANIKLHPELDRYLRFLVVTPEMHRVHHSREPHEHMSNFGFNLACWDYIFSSYCPRSRAGDQFPLGLKAERDPHNGSLFIRPFLKKNPKRFNGESL